MAQPCKCPALVAGTQEQQLQLLRATGVLQSATVRRAEALEEDGELESFISPRNIFIALVLDKEQGHWSLSRVSDPLLPPLSTRDGHKSKSGVWVSCKWASAP